MIQMFSVVNSFLNMVLINILKWNVQKNQQIAPSQKNAPSVMVLNLSSSKSYIPWK
jgi:hypothetical protein